MINLLSAYQRLNASFGKKYIFQFGWRGQGLSVEMLLIFKCALACLHNRIQFCLGENNRPKGFAVEKGWEDYFLPIFPVKQGKWLSLLNRPLYWYPLSRVPIALVCARFMLKRLYPNDLFMSDSSGPLPERIEVKELGIDAGYWEARRQFLDMIWKPRQDVAELIDSYWKNSGLREPFIAVHIRRGDKITEEAYVPVANYLKVLEGVLPSCSSIYVASDDAGVIKELREALPKHTIVNCNPNLGNGHDQAAFNANPKQKRWLETVFFLFELEIMKRAEWFIGASGSCVFYLTRYRRGNINVIDAKTP